MRTFGRYKTAHLCHDRQEGYLPDVRGFTGHVWTGDDMQPLGIAI